MKQCGGVWLPDDERHFVEWMTARHETVDGKLTYQFHKLVAAVKWAKQRRVAVDVGGHVGTWSMHLVNRFEFVHAWEPVAEFRECFARNVAGENHVLYAAALGAQACRATMAIDPKDTGGTHVQATGEAGQVAMFPLDSYDLTEVDFLKIDCEGYELEVLRGAEDTLRRCRPAVVVEQKPHKLAANYGTKGAPAVDFLRGLGAHVRTIMSGDYIMAWD